MRIIPSILLALLCLSAVAQEKPQPIAIDATDKAALDANQEKEVIVSGTIKTAQWSATGKVMNVEFENSPLILAVFERSKDEINKAFEGDAAKKWTGAKVKITGKLGKYGGRAKNYEGRPQIIVAKSDQVKIQQQQQQQ
jgi:DNA/RNA endonuclease YhcR with UshA esterase domain